MYETVNYEMAMKRVEYENAIKISDFTEGL